MLFYEAKTEKLYYQLQHLVWKFLIFGSKMPYREIFANEGAEPSEIIKSLRYGHWIHLVNKKRLFWFVVVILLLSWLLSSRLSLSKSDLIGKYREIDYSIDSRYGSFYNTYEDAQHEYLEWVKNPEYVAMHLIESNEYWTDPFIPTKVDVSYDREGNAIVVITNSRIFDDSIAAVQYIAVLEMAESYWNVVWFGERQQCGRGLSFGWTKNLCP